MKNTKISTISKEGLSIPVEDDFKKVFFVPLLIPDYLIMKSLSRDSVEVFRWFSSLNAKVGQHYSVRQCKEASNANWYPEKGIFWVYINGVYIYILIIVIKSFDDGEEDIDDNNPKKIGLEEVERRCAKVAPAEVAENLNESDHQENDVSVNVPDGPCSCKVAQDGGETKHELGNQVPEYEGKIEGEDLKLKLNVSRDWSNLFHWQSALLAIIIDIYDVSTDETEAIILNLTVDLINTELLIFWFHELEAELFDTVGLLKLEGDYMILNPAIEEVLRSDSDA